MAAESSLEKKLTRYAADRHIWTRKFSSPGNRSVPDRVFMFDGSVLFLEIKAAGEKPTDAQIEQIDSITRAGGLATWADTFDDAKLILDSLMVETIPAMWQRCRRKNYWMNACLTQPDNRNRRRVAQNNQIQRTVIKI